MTPAQPFDYLNHIVKKSKKSDVDYDCSNYVVPLINRGLAQHASLVLYAQDLNKMSVLPTDMQYYWALNAVPKTNVFSKAWDKKDEVTEEIECVSSFFDVSHDIAREYLMVLSKERVNEITQNYKKPDERATRKEL